MNDYGRKAERRMNELLITRDAGQWNEIKQALEVKHFFKAECLLSSETLQKTVKHIRPAHRNTMEKQISL